MFGQVHRCNKPPELGGESKKILQFLSHNLTIRVEDIPHQIGDLTLWPFLAACLKGK